MLQRIKENHCLPFVLLTIMTLLLLFLPTGLFNPLGGGWFFGSEGDWFSQHVAIAESLRQTMLSNHQILPQWIGLGGGSNIYDFAYYGLLRPDVLISCLMPDVEMKYFVAGYAALGVLLSGWFCCIWLQKCGKTRWTSFAGAILMISAVCFYHAHHQIMFVNYMPFLVLALIGVEQTVQKGKISLLAASVFLIILHSFYYAPASICVVGIYAVHRILEIRRNSKSFREEKLEQQVRLRQQESSELRGIWIRFLEIVLAVGLAVGMAMIILLPVGLDILSTTKDGGSAAGKELELLDVGLKGLLYSPYGCGMTLVTLYTLLLSVKKKEKRFLSVTLLAAMLIPAVSLVLNGFLYARAKILIPFVPLLVWVCIDTLQEMWERRQRAEWIPLLCCLIPALCSEWKALILTESVILAIWIAWWRRSAETKIQEDAKAGKQNKITTYVFWLILLVPVCFSLGVNLGDSYLRDFYQRMGITLRESYIGTEEQRQKHIPAEKVEEFAADSGYRFEILADSFVNCNVLPTGGIGRTSMYSSISDGTYANFYYDTMGNAISFNNRVALVAGKNPFFNYFMGVKYLLAETGKVPEGYQGKETYGDYVLAESEEVLPIGYGSTELLSRDAFDALEFPDKLEALCTKTIVEPESMEDFAVETEFKGHFCKQNPEEFFESVETNSLKLSEPLHDQIVVIRFHVNRKNGEEVVITINGIKNKLSSVSAPYPNKNEDFTYIFDSGETLDELQIKKSEGDYEIERLEIYTLDSKYLKHENVTAVTPEDIAAQGSVTSVQNVAAQNDTTAEPGRAGALVFRESIVMEEEGYFVTSYPYRKGYQVWVDGVETTPQQVNTAFLGCPILEGEHTIEIRFTAPGYEIGRLLSIGAAMIWGLILLREIIR